MVTSIMHLIQNFQCFHMLQCLYLLRHTIFGLVCWKELAEREVTTMTLVSLLLLEFGTVLDVGMKGMKGSTAM